MPSAFFLYAYIKNEIAKSSHNIHFQIFLAEKRSSL